MRLRLRIASLLLLSCGVTGLGAAENKTGLECNAFCREWMGYDEPAPPPAAAPDTSPAEPDVAPRVPRTPRVSRAARPRLRDARRPPVVTRQAAQPPRAAARSSAVIGSPLPVAAGAKQGATPAVPTSASAAPTGRVVAAPSPGGGPPTSAGSEIPSGDAASASSRAIGLAVPPSQATLPKPGASPTLIPPAAVHAAPADPAVPAQAAGEAPPMTDLPNPSAVAQPADPTPDAHRPILAPTTAPAPSGEPVAVAPPPEIVVKADPAPTTATVDSRQGMFPPGQSEPGNATSPPEGDVGQTSVDGKLNELLDVLLPGYDQALAVDLALETEILRTEPSPYANCLVGQIVSNVLDRVRTISTGSGVTRSPADLVARVNLTCAGEKASATAVLAAPHRYMDLGRLQTIVAAAHMSSPTLLSYVVATQAAFRSTSTGEQSECLDRAFMADGGDESARPPAMRALLSDMSDGRSPRTAAAQTILSAIQSACGDTRKEASRPPDPAP